MAMRRSTGWPALAFIALLVPPSCGGSGAPFVGTISRSKFFEYHDEVDEPLCPTLLSLLDQHAEQIRLWFNVTRRLFAGGIATSRYDGATRHTSSTLQTTLGAVAGYRLGSCDVRLDAYLLDVVNSGADRNGAALDVSCRLGRRPG